jgi:hypothetical protein
MGSGPNNTVNVASGTSGPAVALEMALLPKYHSEFCTEWKNMKISEGLSNSKNMVFNMKKLLIVAVDVTLLRRGETKRSRRNERQILLI